MKVVRGICPICGKDNNCGAVKGLPPGTCWCNNIHTPKELLARIPDELRRISCVCQDCVIKYYESISKGKTEEFFADSYLDKEINRKFLVSDIEKLNLNKNASRKIVKKYLSVGELEVMICREISFIPKTENHYFLTFKKGSGLNCKDITKQITADDYLKFSKLSIGKTIQKNRFYIPVSPPNIGLSSFYKNSNEAIIYFEVDSYLDDLLGFSVVTVDFPNNEQAESFIPPDWFLSEVTDNTIFNDSHLATLKDTKEFMFFNTNKKNN